MRHLTYVCGILAVALPVHSLPVHGVGSKRCQNKAADESCDAWAKAGECDHNSAFMHTSCAFSCGCPVDQTCGGVTPPAKGTGGIAAMFERAEQMTELGPTVHSRSPWVMTFDHFVTDEECQAFIDTSSTHFDRSLAGDVVSPVRTSRQAWCQPGIATECYNHPLTQRVGERVANVTGVPVANAEFFQVLRYEPGQFYKVHHDQNSQPNSLMGVRLFVCPCPYSCPCPSHGHTGRARARQKSMSTHVVLTLVADLGDDAMQTTAIYFHCHLLPLAHLPPVAQHGMPPLPSAPARTL